MIKQSKIENVVCDIKKRIRKELQRENLYDALALISTCASLLYTTNLYYIDNDLENWLRLIADKIVKISQDFQADEEAVIYYDGFGFNSRGLAQIYVTALSGCKKVTYVTKESRKNDIPRILEILNENDGKVCFLPDGDLKKKIIRLQEIVEEIKPGHFFFYGMPDDVVATTIMHAYQGKMVRYQINLTDHAFWIGCKAIDICIEFREYGASISNEYRNIVKERIVMIPFYPIIDYEMEFQGYPFAFDEGKQRLIFSGGQLYKTLGGNNLYYQIVDYILENYQDAVFWYAGSGERREIDKLIYKYPGRVYLTQERADLYQVLKHCDFYLSTYPVCGGLMLQYAAAAGKIPVTLKYDTVSDGFLLNQDELQIEWGSFDEIKKEIDLILNNENYRKTKEERLMEAVPSRAQFNEHVRLLFSDMESLPKINYSHIDTRKFRKEYLERSTWNTVNFEIARHEYFKTNFKQYPFRFAIGEAGKILKIFFDRAKQYYSGNEQGEAAKRL